MCTRPASRLIPVFGVWAFIAVVIVGCPSLQVVTPSPDASDGAAIVVVSGDDSAAEGAALSPCARACAALSTAKCSLGADNDCAAFLQRDLGTGRVANLATGKPLGCVDVEKVKTKVDAQRLGFSCP